MRRSRELVGFIALTLAVTGVGLAGTVDVAAAGVESCRGQSATIVGTPGSDIGGTDGPDVVVTNGAATTYTGAGDDLVCVTGGSSRADTDVVAGEGDDVVDTLASEARIARVILGGGDDTFTGGPRPDSVWASDAWDSPPGQGADTVSTGGGDDVVLTGGSLGRPDHDTVDLGPGRDDAWLQGAVDPELPIRGGAGSDQLELDRSTLRHALVIDNAAGRATDAGVPVMAWSGMERFRLSPIGSWAAPSFIGGAGSERIWTAIPFTSMDLGGGDDLVNLELQRRLVDHASYIGGAGDDNFILYAGAGDQARRAELDLPNGRLLFRRDQQAVHARIHGFELHRLSARRLDVHGTAATDHVQWSGCRGVIGAGAGDDLIEAISVDDAGCGYLGEDAELVVRGGRGDDRLVGNYMPDVLIGGPGEDQADGRSNRDRCVAETTIRCEP
ncbi:MAG: Hemolysin-type calcium-binding region [Nocardioides sp.]|nr:Hemolysin-type calcium-binding region [Nocardioides sp.]